MALFASGIGIDPTLAASLGGANGIAPNASNAINANYAAAKQKIGKGASTMGMNGAAATGPNSYAGNQLTVGQGVAQDKLAASLGSGLGSTAYQNALQQRDYGQQEQLATQVGNLNSLSALQQTMAGIGSVGGAAMNAYNAYGKFNKPSTTNPYSSDLDDESGDTAYDINNPGPLDLGYSWQ